MASDAPAVLFDVDGTLVDSNYLHVHAWYRAFADAAFPVDAWRVHRSIGMDGSRLVASLAAAADDDTRAHVKDLHSRYYRQTTALLRRLPGTRELLDTVKSLGLQIVLASSAPEDELAILRDVLASDDVVSAVTSSEDVDAAKPDPDIVHVALERAGVDGDRAVFVGDTVWDMQACKRAGLPAVALRCGGVSRGELETAGAVGVFDDAHDLCQHIDTSPIADLLDAPKPA